MKVLQKMELVSQVSKELQRRMTYREVEEYLKAYGVDTKKPTTDINSKYVYARDLLSDESESIIINIADELEINHGYIASESGATVEANFWLPFHFKLFLSHLSSFKIKTVQLQKALLPYGISGFVAHVDIAPTKEWMEEIEASLYSMDALAAILMPGFKESNWTDQEVGAAIGRGILVIPIIRDLDPYGFISKVQGIPTKDRTIGEVAESIFKALTSSPKTQNKMISCLVDTTLSAQSTGDAIEKLGYLYSLKGLQVSHIERIRDGAASSVALSSKEASPKLKELLQKYGLTSAAAARALNDFEDDDIPF